MSSQILSEGRAYINTRGQNGIAPLMLAAQNAHRQVYDFLVGQGANMSILSRADMNILHMACEGGNVPIVKHVLQQTVTDINSRRRDGSTAVMLAVLNGHINVFNLLVGKGVDLTMFDDKGSPLLEKAIQGGNTEIVKYIFNQTRVDINRKHCGLTPVMHAAYCGKLDVFMFFVQKGADLSIRDENHGTILLKACDGGNVDIVQYVLEQNIVEINTKGKEDLTPAMKAARRGHRDIFELLVKKGANLALKDVWDLNILHHACHGGNADIVKYVLKQNIVDINSKAESDKTPAMMAAYKGHGEVFDLLTRNGADITVDVDTFDSNILHLACQGGNVNIVKYVLKQNSIDINTKEEDGRTPAMMAAKSGHGEVLDLLMRKGANLRLEDTYHNNFLYFTVTGQVTEIVEYVITKNIVDINSKDYTGNTPVMLATEKGFGKVFDLFVSKDANLGIVNAKQENILHLACLGSNVEIVKYIFSQNIVDDINTRTKNGKTPLMIAAESQNRKSFDLLLLKGASLALVDNNDNNVLHFASEGGKLEIVEYILTQNIVDINSKGEEGQTAVMKAALSGNREVFHLLVKKGANLSLVDNHGKGILFGACDGGNINIVKYVLSHVKVDTAEEGSKICRKLSCSIE